MLMDGVRPLLGEGVPRGDVGDVLREAEPDVAVLVTRTGQPLELGPDRAVLVPFGGAQHDWAALELAAWLSSAVGAPLKLLGAAGETDEPGAGDPDAGRRRPARAAVRRGGHRAGRGGARVARASWRRPPTPGVLVVGLSERWREEGLGPTRSEIAKAAPAPILFVRRGARAGALAPAGDVTRFSWSSPGMGARRRAAPRPDEPLGPRLGRGLDHHDAVAAVATRPLSSAPGRRPSSVEAAPLRSTSLPEAAAAYSRPSAERSSARMARNGGTRTTRGVTLPPRPVNIAGAARASSSPAPPGWDSGFSRLCSAPPGGAASGGGSVAPGAVAVGPLPVRLPARRRLLRRRRLLVAPTSDRRERDHQAQGRGRQSRKGA